MMLGLGTPRGNLLRGIVFGLVAVFGLRIFRWFWPLLFVALGIIIARIFMT